MDPLTALREMTMRNELDKITKVNNTYIFNSTLSFPCTTETAYRSKQGYFYTLETLVYFITNLHIKHHDYIRNAGTHKIPAVTLLDRKPLIEYLHGRLSNTDAIEFVSHQSFDLFNDFRANTGFEDRPSNFGYPNLNLVPSDDVGFEDLETRVRVRVLEDKKAQIEEIRASERPLRDRETVLECRNKDFYSVLTAATKRDEERQRGET